MTTIWRAPGCLTLPFTPWSPVRMPHHDHPLSHHTGVCVWAGMSRTRLSSYVATAVLGFMLLYVGGESLEALAAPQRRHNLAFLVLGGTIFVVRPLASLGAEDSQSASTDCAPANTL